MAISPYSGSYGSVAKAQVGQQPVLPSAAVGSFKNQQLGGLLSGTSARTGPADALSAMQSLQASGAGQNDVQLGVQRRTAAVATSNSRLLGAAQVQRARNDAQAQARTDAVKRAAGVQTDPSSYQQGSAPAPKRSTFTGSGVAPRSSGGAGQAGTRIESLLTKFPGLRITEIGGDRAYDVKHGVKRVPTSYHYDKNNPAVDIGGSPAELAKLYKELVRVGGWRQILWQSPGHYNHIHVA